MGLRRSFEHTTNLRRFAVLADIDAARRQQCTDVLGVALAQRLSDEGRVCTVTDATLAAETVLTRIVSDHANPIKGR